MRFYKKLGVLVLINVLGVVCSNTTEASNLDTYRNLLKNKSYTIKYTDITPQTQSHNKDKMSIYGKSGLDTSKSDFLANKQTETVVVCDGDNRYEEISYGEYTQCSLTKDEEVFYFAKHKIPGVLSIFGHKKGVVAAVPVNNMATLMQGVGFGTYGMTRYMNVLLPSSQKSKDMPVFRYVNSGWLNNGLNYEDYSYKKGNVMEAVRYYFNGYNLVKIAAATYWENPSTGKMEGTKTIIKINEFSSTPDKTYLELPAGLKDTTKRAKKTEGDNKNEKD